MLLELALTLALSTARSLLRALEVRYPGLGQLVDDGMAIAIDGEVHQDALDEALRADSEVVLIPRIGAG